jgi:hypothetical protein
MNWQATSLSPLIQANELTPVSYCRPTFRLSLQTKKNKKQTVCVVPKMEYLSEYGAQCLTQSELTRQWISLYVRPGADLYRGMLICFTNSA